MSQDRDDDEDHDDSFGLGDGDREEVGKSKDNQQVKTISSTGADNGTSYQLATCVSQSNVTKLLKSIGELWQEATK